MAGRRTSVVMQREKKHLKQGNFLLLVDPTEEGESLLTPDFDFFFSL